MEDLIRWFDARDFFLGLNQVKRDLDAAIQKAQTSHHPDAVWLCSVLAECSDFPSCADVLRSFKDDARALCFSGYLGTHIPGGRRIDLDLIECAANQEHPLALYLLAKWGEGSEEQRNAMLGRSAELDEPLALFAVADSIASPSPEADAMLQRAAMLGNRAAQVKIAEQFDIMDLRRYKILVRGRSVSHFFAWSVRALLLTYLQERNNGDFILSVANLVDRECFVNSSEISHYTNNFVHENVLRALIYVKDEWNKRARAVVLDWSLMALRLPLCKDVRCYIAKMIWFNRATDFHVDMTQFEEIIRGPEYFL